MSLSEDATEVIRVLREIEAKITAVEVRQDQLFSGFPNGDPDAHRRFHESIIEWRELRNQMVREALIQAAKVGGLGAIGWVAYAVWQAIKMEILK